ncbi:MAG: hypothetical protein IT584_00550, partial [Chlamydiae bacterium]|nr:hypothetical protein [Chlamydiota bacterium]
MTQQVVLSPSENLPSVPAPESSGLSDQEMQALSRLVTYAAFGSIALLAGVFLIIFPPAGVLGVIAGLGVYYGAMGAVAFGPGIFEGGTATSNAMNRVRDQALRNGPVDQGGPSNQGQNPNLNPSPPSQLPPPFQNPNLMPPSVSSNLVQEVNPNLISGSSSNSASNPNTDSDILDPGFFEDATYFEDFAALEKMNKIVRETDLSNFISNQDPAASSLDSSPSSSVSSHSVSKEGSSASKPSLPRKYEEARKLVDEAD